MVRRPIVAWAAFWAIGDAIPSLWPGKAALLPFAAALLLLASYALLRRVPVKLVVACAAALLLAGGERMGVDAFNVTHLNPPGEAEDDVPAVVTGILASPVEVDGDMATFTFRSSSVRWEEGSEITKASERIAVRIRLAAEEEQSIAAGWRRGDALRISGELQRPQTAGNFGGFDYRSYLEGQRIHWMLSAKGASAAEALDRTVPWRTLPMRGIDELRRRIGRLLDGLYDGQDAGYMKGLVAGIRDDVDPEQFDAFSSLGLTHVLAISGLHVAVIVFILLRLFALLRLTRERALELTIACLPLYMLLTGASPSAIRACLTGMIALYMARRGKLKDGLHLLAAALIAMLAWDPLLIGNVSFQLSFAVTGGLLLFVPTATSLLPLRRPAVRGAVAVAATAQLVSFPLSAFYFHQFHLLSLPANLLIVPFISSVIMPLGLASAAMAFIWQPLGLFAAATASWGNKLIGWVVGAFGTVPGMQTYWPQPTVAWTLAAYGLLLATNAVLRRRLRERDERRRLREELDGMPPASFDARKRASVVAAYANLAANSGPDTRPLLPEAPNASGAESRRRRAARIAVATGLALLWTAWLVWGIRPAAFDRDAKVMFLDVGQGDGILVRSGEGRFALVDAGGTVRFGQAGEGWRERRDPYEVGKKTVVPLLKQRGVRTLDVLVLSHLDQDHIGGAEAVIENFPVRRILFNGSLKPDATVIRLFRLAEERNIPIFSAYEGMNWQWDSTASWTVLAPAEESEGPIPTVKEQNDRSVVLLLSLYGRTFLLPGDLEAHGEREILAAGNGLPGARPLDVLKAGHHGSHTSSTEEWLRAWSPREVVISVGRSNVYGHPHEDVLERLRTLGIAYYRTDLNGEIVYRVDPDGRLDRRTMRPGADLAR